MRENEEDREFYMRRYPRITAHIIAESLGYATPSCAAAILRDADRRKQNYCEWIDACYKGQAIDAVRQAIRTRHFHSGFMASYKLALAYVMRSVETGREPALASWF